MISAEKLLHGTSLVEEMDAQLGDKRLNDRLKKIVKACSDHPDKSYPDTFDTENDLEAFYRFVRNPNVDCNAVLEPHVKSTAHRCKEVGEVLAIHDTTEFSFPMKDGVARKFLHGFSSKRQGFLDHITIAASADGLRAPLGTLISRPFIHKKGSSKETIQFWEQNFGELSVESKRWWESVENTEKILAETNHVIHVMDRESDIYELMARMINEEYDFIIRATQNRNVIVENESENEPEFSHLFDSLDSQNFICERTIELSPRSHANMPPNLRKRNPARREREATLSFRYITLTINRPKNRTDLKDLLEKIEINVVEAVELSPPEGEEPVRWVLLTTLPISTETDMLRVVDLYRTRWLIEEYNKSIKTGCSYTKRQLDSAEHLLIALSIALPIAWKLLIMRHLERQAPHAGAEAIVNQTQLLCLKSKLPKWKWSTVPTLGEVVLAIARLGGHLKSNGRPGWITLSRGYQKLLEMELGWNAAMLSFKENSEGFDPSKYSF